MLTIKTIVHATDFSKQAEGAFALACSLARDHAARLVVLHVIPPPQVATAEEVLVAPPLPTFNRAEMEARLRQVKPADPAVKVEYRLEEGFAASEILRVAEEERAGLIVLGTHGRTGLGRLLMGSVAENVVRRATCPVLTVKAPMPEEAKKGVA